jgi:putative membrane protein
MLEFMIDLQLAQLALVRGTDSIRSAATDLIESCKRIISDITGIATRKDLALPKSLDDDHETILKDMREKTGSDFDSAYRDRMASLHRQAITLFKRGQTIKVPEISAFASRALAMMEVAYRAYAS